MKEEVNGIWLNYSAGGVGKPLILLHGNGEDHTIFNKLAEKLRPHFSIYAIDSRNHGKSSKTDDYGYETMADDIARFIEKKNLAEASVVGFSDGAIVALTLALRKKNIFRRMALLGVNLKPGDFKEEVYDEIRREYELTKDPLTGLMLEQPCIELDALKNIDVPTLLVAAENDVFKHGLYLRMAETIPGATLRIMQGHSHDSYIINRDILFPFLYSFLSDTANNGREESKTTT